MGTPILKILNDTTGEWESIPAIKGADGHTPVRGTDYWTAEDQQAIVDAVLTALPAAEGGSY